MSEGHHYHLPNAPSSYSDGSDSDIELDLEELDPHTSSRGNRRIDAPNNGQNGQRSIGGRTGGRIPLRNLRIGRTADSERQRKKYGNDNVTTHTGQEVRGQRGETVGSEDSQESSYAIEDEVPLLNHTLDLTSGSGAFDSGQRGIFSRLPRFLLGDFDHSVRGGHPPGSSHETQTASASRNISIGQYPQPRFPPNAVSNAKYTAWSFLPRTLYNEFSFFYNLYFLLVALSQIIPPLRIGYLSTYAAPLVFVLIITLGKEALDDIGRRRRDSEANKEEYTVLRLRDLRGRPHGNLSKKGLRKRPRKGLGIAKISRRTRLDAIEEEEENMGGNHTDSLSSIKVDEIRIRSRDLKVGDVLKLGKDQRVPADLVILKSYTTESAAMAPDTSLSEINGRTASGSVLGKSELDSAGNLISMEQNSKEPASPINAASSKSSESVGETFIRTDQLDGETDWKLRLASPLTQSLDPRNFTRLRLVAAMPDRKVHEFYGTIEYTPQATGPSTVSTQRDDKATQTAPLTIDNTAWANTVLASNAAVLAVVVYTGAQTRQALSTSASRSKTGLLDHEINNLTKILFALTLTLSVILVALEGFETRGEDRWYIAIPKFLILYSTIIPISLRVNLDMGKSVYAWFIERDQGIPGTVVRTSTIPEELGRIEYLLSDKTGTLTQNGTYPNTFF